MSSFIKVWLQAARPRTLPASLAPIVLGNWLAYKQQPFSWWIAISALLCAMALQVLVNFANDYFDNRSGVDTDARLGPQRVMQAGLISSRAMLAAMGVTAALATVTGLVLVWLSSWWLLPLGGLCLAGAYLYSGGPRPLASLGLGEITVFLFFGLLAVAGSYFAQTGHVSLEAWLGAVITGMPIAAIMLVNNLRDIATDSLAGKRTLAVRLGHGASCRLYYLLVLGPAFMLLLSSNAMSFKAIFAAVLTAVPGAALSYRLSRTSGAALNLLLGLTANYVVWVALVFAVSAAPD